MTLSFVLAALSRFSIAIPRRKEDYTFDRSTLQSVRAAGCAGTELPPVYFLLSSTPNRAERLPVLLETMRAQTHPPKGVVLTIPRVFARFNESYRLPDASRWPELRVNVVDEDAGPLSKFARPRRTSASACRHARLGAEPPRRLPLAGTWAPLRFRPRALWWWATTTWRTAECSSRTTRAPSRRTPPASSSARSSTARAVPSAAASWASAAWRCARACCARCSSSARCWRARARRARASSPTTSRSPTTSSG